MTIGSRIKQRRKALGLSAEDLAARLGKSPATIYRYENGEIEKLPSELIEPLAESLLTSPAWLMGWDDERDDVSPRAISDAELMFALWGDAETMDGADLDAVRRYAAFLKAQKQSEI